MKKLTVIITILLSFFIFDATYKEASLNEYASLKNINSSIISKGKLKEMPLNFILNKDGGEVFLSSLTEFLRDNNATLTIQMHKSITQFNQHSEYYLYSEDPKICADLYSIKEGKTIDFSTTVDDYYTSDFSDKNSLHHIVYLNKNYNKKYYDVINIIPLRNIEIGMLEKKGKITASLFAKDIQSLDGKLKKSDLYKYVMEGSTSLNHYDNGNTTFNQSMNIALLILGFISMLSVFTCLILQLKKEIIIRKLHGVGSIKIANKLLGKQFAFIICTYLLVQVFSYVLLISSFYPNGIALIKQLLVYCGLFIFVLLIIYFIIIGVCFSVKDIEIIKQSKTNKIIANLNFIVKLMVLILLFNPLTMTINSVYNDILLLDFHNQQSARFSKQLYIGGVILDKNPDKFEEIRDKVLGYFDMNGGYYQNFVYNEIAPSLSEAPTINYKYIEVNTNFLKEYELYDEHNQLITAKDIIDNTVLVPLQYREKQLSGVEYDHLVYIKEGINFIRKDIPVSNATIAIKDPIIKVYNGYNKTKNWGLGPLFNILPIHSDADVTKFDQFIIDQGLKGQVVIKQYRDDLLVIKYQETNRIITNMMLVLILLITIALFTFETLYMYINQNRKNIATQYLLGISSIKRYSQIWIFNMVSSLLVLLSGIVLFGVDVLALMGCIGIYAIFETILGKWMINKFEKKHLVKSLKGE